MCVCVSVYLCACASPCSGRAAELQGGSGYIVILNRVFSAARPPRSHSAERSVSSLPSLLPLPSRDQTVNLTHSALMTSLMVRKTANSTAVMLLLEWLECCIVLLV